MKTFSLICGALLLFALFVSLDAEISRNLWQWPALERTFFYHLARLGESDWMLIPTLLVWGMCQIAGFVPMGFTIKWALRSLGAMAGYIFVSVAVPGAIAALLKIAIGRARPVWLDDLGVLHFMPFAGDWRFAGFPSGHATTAFALAWAIYFLFGRVGAFAFIGAFLIALSRVVDGAHYFSDVIVGSLLGSAGAFVIFYQFRQRGWIFDKTSPGAKNRMMAPLKRLLKRS